jgi:selenocysteine lyase/cysteine desulfurase
MFADNHRKYNKIQLESMNMENVHKGGLNLRDRIVGIDQQVPLLDGRLVSYVNLDNSASTPPLVDVKEAIDRFLPYYSSVHRGTGFKSRLSTAAYDQAHEIIAEFLGADSETNTVIFGKNTTEAINKLSHRLPMTEDAIVLSTQMEHHSNDLPWRHRGKVAHIKVTADGTLDETDFDEKLSTYGSRIALLAVTGASNVSGRISPIHRWAEKAHSVGAKILVDAAQLAPHRKIEMLEDDHPEHLDFVAISGHKMYAPYGTGALIGPKEVFLQAGPEYSGGGTVDVVTLDEVYWAGMPDRDEAGSPNVIGAVAIAAAAKVLMEVGMDQVAAHEESLIAYTLERFASRSYLQVYGETNPAKANEKVGAVPFNVKGMSHFLVSSILGYEGGIGVRSGCFCAHPYVVQLLKLEEHESRSWREQILQGDRSNMPGMIRASFGCYNNENDVDRLVEMLDRISRGEYEGSYALNPGNGEYVPKGFIEPLAEHFSLT